MRSWPRWVKVAVRTWCIVAIVAMFASMVPNWKNWDAPFSELIVKLPLFPMIMLVNAEIVRQVVNWFVVRTQKTESKLDG
jgi:hypothetical protein